MADASNLLTPTSSISLEELSIRFNFPNVKLLRQQLLDAGIPIYEISLGGRVQTLVNRDFFNTWLTAHATPVTRDTKKKAATV